MSAVTEHADMIWQSWIETMPDLFTQPSFMVRANVHHRIAETYRPKGALVDLGGGLSLANGLLARMGMRVHVFDIFQYDLGWMRAQADYDYAKLRDVLSDAGVTFVETDICKCNLREYFAAKSVDAVSSYHCFEHLHQSPRRTLESALPVLKPDGVLLIEVPNAVNLLKRCQVVFGQTNYADYRDYYESDNFTGHVREYSVGDLKQLATYLGLDAHQIYGRNWYGTLYDRLGTGWFAQFADFGLRRFPGLCGSLFLKVSGVP